MRYLTAILCLASAVAFGQTKSVIKDIATNGLTENLTVPVGKTFTVAGTITCTGTATGFSADWSTLANRPAALTAIGALTPAAYRVPVYSGASSASLYTISTGGTQIPVFSSAPMAEGYAVIGSAGAFYQSSASTDVYGDNIVGVKPTVLTLSSGTATWANPIGRGILTIAAPTQSAKLTLTSTGGVHAWLVVRTELPCLLSFGGDAASLTPIALQAGSDNEFEISRDSSTASFVVASVKTTLIPGDEAAAGSPVLHLNPSKWTGLASTTSRTVYRWPSVVGSNYALAVSANPTFAFTDPADSGAVVHFVGASSQLMTLNSSVNSGSAYTILVAFKCTAAPVAFGMFSGSGNHYFGVTSGGAIVHYNGSTTFTTVNLGLGTTQTGWVVAAIRQGTTSRDLFVNLTKIKTTTGVSHALQISHIGSYNNGGYNFTGDIGEYLAYDSYLSDADIATELTRMCKRWRTQARFMVCDGNSLTAGTNDGEESGTWAYPTRLAALAPYDWVFNYGVSGQKTTDMSSDAATEIDPFSVRIDTGGKNLLTAWEIGNDLGNGTSVATAETNWSTYCTARRSAGFRVLTVDVPYRNVTGNLTDGNLDTVNAWMLANYTSWADNILRLSQIAEINTKSDRTFRTSTTIHYYSTGYWRIAQEVFKILAQP